MKNQFKFVIEKPKRKLAQDGYQVYVRIYAKYPHVVYPIDIESYSSIQGDDDRIRLAIAQLKVDLIQQISNAEFEYTK